MKQKVKAMFVIAALTLMPMMAKAQQFTESLYTNSWPGIMPKQFSFDNKAKLTGLVESDGNLMLNVYNSELEVEKNIVIEGVEDTSRFYSFDLFLDIDENLCSEGICIDVTQTLFNDDEKYEYILPLYVEEREVGFRIMSEDGAELTRVYYDNYENILKEDFYTWIEGIIKYGDNTYLIERKDDDSYGVYSYFFKVDRKATSVKAVTNMPAAITGHFSLDGKRQSSPRRGINITRHSDGTVSKYIKK